MFKGKIKMMHLYYKSKEIIPQYERTKIVSEIKNTIKSLRYFKYYEKDIMGEISHFIPEEGRIKSR